MQKNTKDSINEETINNKATAKSVVKVSKKANTLKKEATKKTSVAKSASSKTSTKTASASKKSTAKKTTTAKKSTSKKTSTSKKASARKAKVASSRSSKAKSKKVEIIEYYDLPYRYNQTVVKILAQTPTTLFVYWDISDKDRKKYIDDYGENFFENTVPILIVHNKTMNYSFEIEINDFANSWYFNVNDSKCDYEIELGRRAKHEEISLPNNYMHITSSNVIESPNNHILFERNQKTLFFRNVKTNTTISKDVNKFEFMKYLGKIYNIYDVYRKIYKTEELQDLENNPSSRF